MHNEHGGHHHHDHMGESALDDKKASSLLSYMLTHNIQHAEELHKLAHQLVDLGQAAAAAQVDEALELYKQGNAKLQNALDQMK